MTEVRQTRTQKKSDRALIEQSLAVVRDEAILYMIHNGESIPATANKMGVTTTDVRKLLEKVLTDTQELTAEHAEYVYNINYMRLEHLYNRSMIIAFEGTKKGEKLPSEHAIKWAAMALNVIKEQNKMSEAQMRYRTAPPGETNPLNGNGNINVLSQTIVAGDDMFKMAQESMSEVFMDKHAHRLGTPGPGDVTPDEMLVMELKPQVGLMAAAPPPPEETVEMLTETVLSLQDKLDALAEKFGVEDAGSMVIGAEE